MKASDFVADEEQWDEKTFAFDYADGDVGSLGLCSELAMSALRRLAY